MASLGCSNGAVGEYNLILTALMTITGHEGFFAGTGTLVTITDVGMTEV